MPATMPISAKSIDQLLRQRLQSSQLSQLLIVTQKLESEAGLAFGKMLRPESTEAEILEEYRVSQHWSNQLAASWPEQVTAVSSKLAASAPLLLLDDQLFVGHYAHSPHLAPLDCGSSWTAASWGCHRRAYGKECKAVPRSLPRPGNRPCIATPMSWHKC